MTGLRQQMPREQKSFGDWRRNSRKFVARLKAEMNSRPLQEWQRKGRRLVARIRAEVRQAKIDDEARFIRMWLDKPLVTGAVSPSSKALARKMASYVDPASQGPVIELGPGTGPVTDALLARGIAEDRLVLVEYNPEFCALLKKRYPKATVLQGDAYALAAMLAHHLARPAAACLSSLPLFTKPEWLRLALVNEAFALMMPGAPFIQFTYAAVSPVPRKRNDIEAHVSPRVWKNLPPACVWVYRRLQA